MSAPENSTETNPEAHACCGGHHTEPRENRGVSRRTVLATAGAMGAAGVLAACTGSSDSSSQSASPNGGGSEETDTTTDVPTDSPMIANTSDIPVGGATFVESRGIVVAQPTDGQFKAFDARCPHQGCMVTRTQGSDLLCPCHASLFSSQTGDVVRGPATSGLDEVAIKVEGDTINLA